MAKYHVNPQNGEAGKCSAKHSCPFGDMAADHYASEAEARDSYEAAQGSSFSSTMKKPSGSKALQDLMDRILIEPGIAGKEFAFTHDEMMRISEREWLDTAAQNRALAEELGPLYEQHKAQLRAKSTPTTSEEDLKLNTLRAQLGTAKIRAQMAEQVAEVLTTRQEDGITLPPGYAMSAAVYDLNGNLLGAAKDTYFGPQSLKLTDGTKISYRASRAADPERRRASEAKKGYYTGKAAVPVGVELNHRMGVRVKPAYSKISANPSLAIAVDDGQG